MSINYRGEDLNELIKHHVAQRVRGLAIALDGTITSTDPATQRAKVMLDMTGTETGWLPIGALLAGPGYGVYALPEDGAHVTVLFEGGDGQGTDLFNSGKILLYDFNQVDTVPVKLQPGEIMVQSVGDASAKFDKSGRITLNGGTKPVARVGDTVQVTINGSTYTGTIESGNFTVLA